MMENFSYLLVSVAEGSPATPAFRRNEAEGTTGLRTVRDPRTFTTCRPNLTPPARCTQPLDSTRMPTGDALVPRNL
jgi:hypothetical protein